MSEPRDHARATEHDDFRTAWDRDDDNAWDRCFQVAMCASSPKDCDALLRGQYVPVSRLDSKWVKEFGWRSRGDVT